MTPESSASSTLELTSEGRGIDPASIDAIVFDIGGVFTVPHHETMSEGLRAAGFEAPLEVDMYLRAHYRGVRALTEAALSGAVVEEMDIAFWGNYNVAFLGELGIPATVDEAAAAFKALFDNSPARVWRHLLEHNVAGFHRLAASKAFPLAIVSNNDGTAAAQLIEYGVCQAGEGPLPSVVIVVDSAIVGVRKPDPAIFTPALEALGTKPERTLYVGDTYHADVMGARAAGLQVVQIDPFGFHEGFDHWRVTDVQALADLLGID